VLYAPLLPFYFFNVLYTRRFLYFTAANPGIELGGFFGEKKFDIQMKIPESFRVETFLVEKGDDVLNEKWLSQNQLAFPLIAKPNVGERGFKVSLIRCLEELRNYQQQGFDFLVQRYYDLPIELGVLFYYNPLSKSFECSSVTQKEFLTVLGDGKNSVRNLLLKHQRGQLYAHLLKDKDLSVNWDYVPAFAESYVVHRIGNHSKGTRFLNANHLIAQGINTAVNRIAEGMQGIHYGRMDLKVASFKSLLESKDTKVFEINGVSSEAGHIYDLPTYLHAYKDIAKEWLRIGKISKYNIKKGVKTTPFPVFLKQIIKHFNL
jgi:hypothetical protein